MKTISLFLSTFFFASLGFSQQRIFECKTSLTSYGAFSIKKQQGIDLEEASVVAKHAVKKTAGGTSTFVKFNARPSNIKEKTIKKDVSAKVGVYPNPSNGEMTIKYFIPKNEKAEFAIYDLTGKRVANYTLVGERNQLIISETGLISGVYFYNVVSSGKIVGQDKLVIIK